ncbi:hypothetical protein, partial [Pseudomonas aeruginosa]|uniref:hypothetical protein n=1 Tax=Pseudomonas aeruginosa TaxID=287 RepID=UPI0013DFB4D3
PPRPKPPGLSVGGVVAFCVLFQERGVVPVRKGGGRGVGGPPALAKVPRPA